MTVLPLGALVAAPLIPCFPPMVGFLIVPCTERWMVGMPRTLGFLWSPGWVLFAIFETHMFTVFVTVFGVAVHHAAFCFAVIIAYCDTLCR